MVLKQTVLRQNTTTMACPVCPLSTRNPMHALHAACNACTWVLHDLDLVTSSCEARFVFSSCLCCECKLPVLFSCPFADCATMRIFHLGKTYTQDQLTTTRASLGRANGLCTHPDIDRLWMVWVILVECFEVKDHNHVRIDLLVNTLLLGLHLKLQRVCAVGKQGCKQQPCYYTCFCSHCLRLASLQQRPCTAEWRYSCRRYRLYMNGGTGCTSVWKPHAREQAGRKQAI